jgi:uncharacterized protein
MARKAAWSGVTGHSWMSRKLEVRRSRRHRRGVFAREGIPAGERLAIFGGDVMWIDEINDLPGALRGYPMQIEERFVLGARTGRTPERTDYFNHSCEPNCGFRGQMFLVAMRDIRKGEEVTFDYAMVVSPSVGSPIVFEMECHCGTRSCRKRITEQDWEIPELRRRYAGYFSQYLQDLIAAQLAGAPAPTANPGAAAAPTKRAVEPELEVAIVMQDDAASEIHHFVKQANQAQASLRFSHVLAPQQTARSLAAKRMEASLACETVFGLRRGIPLQREDVIIGFTAANIYDPHDDEFLMVNGEDHPRRGRSFARTVVVSMYFLHARSSFMRGDPGTPWRALSDPERKQKHSDAILLLLLTSVASELTGLACHETSVGCVMDYCEIPSELLQALRAGFIFCKDCRSQLERTAEGRAVLSIATRLTHYRLTPAAQRTAFLSYAHKDQEAVLAVDQWLRDHGILTRLDRYDFRYGQGLREEIKRSMHESSSIVVFFSKNSKHRKYTRLERKLANSLQQDGRSRVIYFCLDDTPFPDEHAAARVEIRAKGKTFEDACSELLAGILSLRRVAEGVDLGPYATHPPWA